MDSGESFRRNTGAFSALRDDAARTDGEPVEEIRKKI